MSDAPRPRLSVSMLCLNLKETSTRAVESLFASTSGEFELLIHDNGSNDGTKEWIEALVASRPDQVRATRAERNEGFIVPQNRNLARARGEFFCMANNDLVFPPGWDDVLIAPMLANPLVAATGPRDSHGCLDSGMVGRPCGPGERREYLSGHCLMLRRLVAEQVGGLDDGLQWMYGEDSDLCLQLRSAGYDLVAVDSLDLQHEVGATVRTVPQGLIGFDPAEAHRRNHAYLRKKWAHYLIAKDAAR